MAEKLVSIIMPTYNRAHVIPRAIKSVLKQTYQNWELLIIDDGSADNTEQVIMAIDDSRICYVKLPENKGACYARNRGLERAKGEYIAFLDSDNVWMKNYLEERIKTLESSPAKVGGVFGSFMQMCKGKQTVKFPPEEYAKGIRDNKSHRALVKQMLFDNVIDTNTIVLKRKCVGKVSGFNDNLKRLQDWEYFFRVLCFSGYRLIFRDDCLVRNYIQKDSITRKSNNEAYWDTRVFFLREYKDVFKQYNCFYDAIVRIFSMREFGVDEEILCPFLNELTEDEVKKVTLGLREKYVENVNYAEYLVKHIEGLSKLREKEYLILQTQSKWLQLKQQGVDLGELLVERGYKSVAIYGYGHLGKLLYRELRFSSSVCLVSCVIDKFLGSSEDVEVPIVSPGEFRQDADAVIVTAIYDFESIKQEYEKDIVFVSLQDVIDGGLCK